MAEHQLDISVSLWSGQVSIWQEHLVDGTYERGLPPKTQDMGSRMTAWARLSQEHFTWAKDANYAQGWDAEGPRQEFFRESRGIAESLKKVLGRSWEVRVSPEPAVTVVRLMGEYGCEWPLWAYGGGTGPESWPMLSDQLRDRLLAWAVQAEPDHLPRPDPDVTARLARDLRSELGSGFLVEVHT